MAFEWYKLQITSQWFDQKAMTTYCYRVDSIADRNDAAGTIVSDRQGPIVDALRAVWPESVQHIKTVVRAAEDPSLIFYDEDVDGGWGTSAESHLPHEICAVLLLRRTDSAPFTKGRSFVGPIGAAGTTNSGYWAYPDGTDLVTGVYSNIASAMADPGNAALRFDIWSAAGGVGVPVGIIELSNRWGRQRRRRRGSRTPNEVWPNLPP
jgi:hypothetical protein